MSKKKNSKSKKEKKVGIKAITKEFTEEYLSVYPDESKILLTATSNFTDKAHADATHVVYVLRPNNFMEMWVRYVDEDTISWRREFDKISPARAAAEAHLDATKWRLFQQEGTKRRKKDISPADRDRLRCAVRYFYDLQKLRIQAGNRDSDQAEPAVLDDEDKDFLGQQSVGINALEKACLSEIEGILEKSPIYTTWLKHQKGCGPTMSGVLISEIDIGGYRVADVKRKIKALKSELNGELTAEELSQHTAEIAKLKIRLTTIKPCDTPSALWAYAGLNVNTETGRAVRREKGVKSNWNPFLKAKVVFVLGGCLLKANSPWRKFYDDYKHRKENQLVPVCMLCDGLGGLKTQEGKQVAAQFIEKGAKKCYNCDGKMTNVPWGRGDAHRHMAAVRYMVKCFLLELWTKWRELEGLPVTKPYAEAKLGIKHGDHASTHEKHKAQERASGPQKPMQRERANVHQHP